MRQRLTLLFTLFFSTVALFLLQKPLFMLYHLGAHPEVVATDFADVMLHSLSLDLTTAAYITAVPWLTITLGWIISWLTPSARFTNHTFNPPPPRGRAGVGLFFYYSLISLLMSIVFVADTVLYGFWGFKIDSTVFAYTDKPADAAASVSALFLAAAIAAIIVLALLYAFIFTRIILPRRPMRRPRSQWSAIVMLPIGGLLFLAIRGGVGEGTANVSRAYYSENQFLNHSAVNPMFNMVYSLMHQQNFAKQFRYMDDAERQRLISDIYPKLAIPEISKSRNLEKIENFDSLDSREEIDTLLLTPRPNILLIVWEGCGASMVQSLGGSCGVTPNLERIASEGVLFTQCYASSFRTDRGLVSIMSGWPGMPSASLMKMPNKCNQLPGLARELAREGYTTDFWYGGDITFTNMGGYMLASGFQTTHSDTDFSADDRQYSKWGVTDGVLLDRLADDIAKRPADSPWFTTVLTLSSHEPWEVPYSRLDDEKQNAFAYTDHCIGQFISKLQATKQWRNTLVVIVPDHGVVATDADTRSSLGVIHIPLVMAGGAIAQHGRHIDTIMSQSDLAATLLAQLGISPTPFRFSRNVLSPSYRYPTALHTSPIDATLIDSTGITTYDISGNQVTFSTDANTDTQRTDRIKAALQTMYDEAAAL